MNEPMSDSCKQAVEECKKWIENELARSSDFKKGLTPRPHFQESPKPYHHSKG